MESESDRVTFEVMESAEERLAKLEQAASKCFKASLDAFVALKQIRDDRLYLARGYTAWSDYCKEVWNITPNYAYMQIEAVECRSRVVTMVTSTAAGELTTERQLRELKAVPDDSLQDVLEEADILATSTGAGRISAGILKQARTKVLGGRKKKKKRKQKSAVEVAAGNGKVIPFVIEAVDLPPERLEDSRQKALKALEQARRHMGILGLDKKWDKTLNKMMDAVEAAL